MERVVWACVLGSCIPALTGCGLFDIYDCEVPVFHVVAPPDEKPERLRIISFNVLHGYPDFPNQEERYGDMLEALRSLEPDVLILQEVWRTWKNGDLARRLAADLCMDMAYGRANGYLPLLGFEEGSAVLSRYPILRAERIRLLPRDPWWESRIALVASLWVHGDETLTVVGTHLTDRSIVTATRQAEFLWQRISRLGSVAVVAGDFNAPSGSPVLEAFTDHGLIDILPGGIDHILVDQEWMPGWRLAAKWMTLRPEDLALLIGEASRISDHPGLLVELIERPVVEEPAAARVATREPRKGALPGR